MPDKIVEKYQVTIVTLSSLLSITLGAFLIWQRIQFALTPTINNEIEIYFVVFDLPIVVPGILGFTYFLRQAQQKDFVSQIYSALILILSVGLFIVYTQTDALAAGLPMLMFILPASIIASILLIIQIQKNKKQKHENKI